MRSPAGAATIGAIPGLLRILCLAAAIVATPAVASAAEPLARTAAPYDAQRVAVDAWGGVIAYSQFDAASYQFRLAVIRGGAPELLPVAAQPEPFDLDVGPGPDGTPTLVYSRCPTATTGCDLYRYSFATATEAPIAGSNSSSEEVAPSIWKDTIAFARTRSRVPRRGVVPHVYTRPLDRPETRSTRVPVMPARECQAGFCRTTTYGTVDETELHGSRLAAVVHVGPGTADAPNVEVRLIDRGKATRVANTAVGAISVRKQFLGLSFERGSLVFARSFYYSRADTLYRFEIATRRYTSAALPRMTYGLAAVGGGRYVRLGTCRPGCPTIPPPEGSTPYAPGPLPLDLTRTEAARFVAARAPL
jgi:hypothetical protein